LNWLFLIAVTIDWNIPYRSCTIYANVKNNYVNCFKKFYPAIFSVDIFHIQLPAGLYDKNSVSHLVTFGIITFPPISAEIFY